MGEAAGEQCGREGECGRGGEAPKYLSRSSSAAEDAAGFRGDRGVGIRQQRGGERFELFVARVGLEEAVGDGGGEVIARIVVGHRERGQDHAQAAAVTALRQRLGILLRDRRVLTVEQQPMPGP
ncbi:hypothetical protein [Streptomyces sp. NPDC051921]|uniref:hypothetical protein n=1 Tax=Streptomyces sp. NPDC051921 TaxID=3155806 RepID=UPI00343D9F76